MAQSMWMSRGAALGVPIILHSCHTASSGYVQSVARETKATIYAARDFAFTQQLSPGVYEAFSATRTKDGKIGTRTSFAAVGNGARPFGDDITSIVIDRNAGKVTVTSQRRETGSRISRTEKVTKCYDKDKC